jgi:hypothetical protein
MRVPHSLIVPDSKPPMLLMSLGATLLAGLVIRALRRRHRRASSSVVNGTGRPVRQPSSARAKPRGQLLLEASVGAAPRASRSRAPVYER